MAWSQAVLLPEGSLLVIAELQKGGVATITLQWRPWRQTQVFSLPSQGFLPGGSLGHRRKKCLRDPLLHSKLLQNVGL